MIQVPNIESTPDEADDGTVFALVIPVIIIVFSIYSNTVNRIFGHQSYWRSSYSRSTQNGILIGLRTQASWTLPSLLASKQTIVVGEISKIKCRFQLNQLDDAILREIISYLGVYNLLKCRLVCRRFSHLIDDPKTWINIQKQLFLPEYVALGNIVNFKDFFHQVRKYYQFYMDLHTKNDENRVYVIINRNIYDITIFIGQHPGGGDILIEMKGQDATRKFNLACHSPIAHELMQEYLVWSPYRWFQ